MIDHVSVPVRDLSAPPRSTKRCSATLGYTKLETRPATVGFGKRYSEFWINHRPGMPPAADAAPMSRCAREPRDGRCLSRRGACPWRHVATARRVFVRNTGEGYYAAYIRDPDGNRIEAVTFLK